jgi:hypothetical protein
MYQPSTRQLLNAKNIGVNITPSNVKNKKLSVYKNGVKVADIGSYGALDYSIYKSEFGINYANERKRLYKIRHQKYRNIKGTPAYYADQILWT